jgi:hypothetical protein
MALTHQELEQQGAEFLAHYGVLGMKWGQHRAKANAHDIHAARTRLARDRVAVDRAHNKASKVKDPQQRQAAKASADRLHANYLNNPDRVIANRLTTGEKVLTALFLTPVGAATVIGATSARSRRIERKQDKGKYKP